MTYIDDTLNTVYIKKQKKEAKDSCGFHFSCILFSGEKNILVISNQQFLARLNRNFEQKFMRILL